MGKKCSSAVTKKEDIRTQKEHLRKLDSKLWFILVATYLSCTGERNASLPLLAAITYKTMYYCTHY